MERENKRNNALDNLEDNRRVLYEILGIVGEIKARINGCMPLAEKCKESGPVERKATINGGIEEQTGILADIFTEVREIYESV